MSRYHVWTHADSWDEDPKRSGAEFLGLFDDVEKIITFLEKRYLAKQAVAKESYAVVTMGDMSPAGLAATGGADPDDICVFWIGRYTAEEAEKLMPEWEEEYADEITDGCWISTVYDEHPDIGFCNDWVNVWDTKAGAWRSFFEEDGVGTGVQMKDHWRKKLTEPVQNVDDESELPIPGDET
jgi:hypothetical protein